MPTDRLGLDPTRLDHFIACLSNAILDDGTEPNLPLIREWVAGLRSGHWSQTSGLPRDSVGYCCLGVACDLYITRWRPSANCRWDSELSFVDSNGYEYNETANLPPEVGALLGLGEEACDVLATANDGGATFAQIADIIEGAIPTLKE